MKTPTLGTATVIRANARVLPLADDSVDLVVTSPPYFALRSYQDGGEHYAGQVGDEPTMAEFVDSLLAVTRECVRVLKPSGSLWVNLGDKYVADNRGSGTDTKRMDAKWAPRGDLGYVGREVAPRKSLMGIPWRYANRVTDELGLILRAEVIWSKPNGLPESVTDRVRRSHEAWFHFTLEPRYFSAVDEIREGYAPGTAARYAAGYNPRAVDAARPSVNTKLGGDTYGENPLGKLPGSVWTVPTEPLKVPDHISHAACCHGRKRPGCEDGIDHFAAFPTAWPKRIIRGWSPTGVCVECGEGRRPVTSEPEKIGGRVRGEVDAMALGVAEVGGHGFTAAGARSQYTTSRTISGYVCACPEPTAATTPAVVLDPFGGTGTTAMVAKALGQHGISVDMSADYCRLAAWRTNDRDQLAKVLGVAKAEQQPDAQLDMFALLGEETA